MNKSTQQARAIPSPFLKFINIFLLGLIILGIGLLVTYKSWIPQLVYFILDKEQNTDGIAEPEKSVSTSTISIQPLPLRWVTLSSKNKIFSIENGKVYVKTGDGPVEVLDADAATFMVPDDSGVDKTVAYKYAKDKNMAYRRTLVSGTLLPLQDVDLETFIVVNGGDVYDAKDKNHKYFAGGIICEDMTKKTCTLYDGPGEGNNHWYQNLNF